MRILTAANDRYFRSLCQMLLSARRFGHIQDCRVFDLGLSPTQIEQLGTLFPGLDIRPFDFAQYPAHVRLEAESYAWKPVIIAGTMDEGEELILWLDSASLILSRLDPIEERIRQFGQYVPHSGARDAQIKKWTHPDCLERLGIEPGDPIMLRRQRAGMLCGFDTRFQPARQLLLRWRELALDPDVITPAGSSRLNHRQDESIMTILLYLAERQHQLTLTTDECDLNSVKPIPWISSRHKLSNRIPVWLDLVVWRYCFLDSRIGVLKRRWREWAGTV